MAAKQASGRPEPGRRRRRRRPRLGRSACDILFASSRFFFLSMLFFLSLVTAGVVLYRELVHWPLSSTARWTLRRLEQSACRQASEQKSAGPKTWSRVHNDATLSSMLQPQNSSRGQQKRPLTRSLALIHSARQFQKLSHVQEFNWSGRNLKVFVSRSRLRLFFACNSPSLSTTCHLPPVVLMQVRRSVPAQAFRSPFNQHFGAFILYSTRDSSPFSVATIIPTTVSRKARSRTYETKWKDDKTDTLTHSHQNICQDCFLRRDLCPERFLYVD